MTFEEGTEYNQIQHELLVTLERLIQRGFNKELIARVLGDLIMHPEKGVINRRSNV